MRNLTQDSTPPGPDLNTVPPQYDKWVLISELWHLAQILFPAVGMAAVLPSTTFHNSANGLSLLPTYSLLVLPIFTTFLPHTCRRYFLRELSRTFHASKHKLVHSCEWSSIQHFTQGPHQLLQEAHHHKSVSFLHKIYGYKRQKCTPW